MMRSNSGFSLIELFAAMAILMAVVSMMGIIFTDSDRAWTLGTGRAENNTSGRAAINMIVRDLQYAVADDLLTYVNRRDRYNIMSLGYTNDEVCCVSLQHDSKDGNRTAREIHYNLKPTTGSPATYELRRGYWAGAISQETGNTFARHCYHRSTWFESGDGNPGRPSYNRVIAANVVGFAVFACDQQDNVWREYYSDSPAHSNRTPKYVDISLEILDQRHAEQVSDMTYRGEDPAYIKEFVERKLRRYTSRVHFCNRSGYKREHTWPEKYDQGRLY
jgi:type II secretory pathway component PulJ